MPMSQYSHELVVIGIYTAETWPRKVGWNKQRIAGGNKERRELVLCIHIRALRRPSTLSHSAIRRLKRIARWLAGSELAIT